MLAVNSRNIHHVSKWICPLTGPDSALSGTAWDEHLSYIHIWINNILVILLCNLTIIITICMNRNLHKPMYILLLNLPINDAMNATSLFPHLLYSIWSQDRSISYPACFFKAFSHTCMVEHLILFLLLAGYDRYIAICCPLRYGAIMTTNNGENHQLGCGF